MACLLFGCEGQLLMAGGRRSGVQPITTVRCTSD